MVPIIGIAKKKKKVDGAEKAVRPGQNVFLSYLGWATLFYPSLGVENVLYAGAERDNKLESSPVIKEKKVWLRQMRRIVMLMKVQEL